MISYARNLRCRYPYSIMWILVIVLAVLAANVCRWCLT